MSLQLQIDFMRRGPANQKSVSDTVPPCRAGGSLLDSGAQLRRSLLRLAVAQRGAAFEQLQCRRAITPGVALQSHQRGVVRTDGATLRGSGLEAGERLLGAQQEDVPACRRREQHFRIVRE